MSVHACKVWISLNQETFSWALAVKCKKKNLWFHKERFAAEYTHLNIYFFFKVLN